MSKNKAHKELYPKMSAEDNNYAATLYIMIYQCATLLVNFNEELKALYERHGKYKMTIKHFYNQIQKMVKESADFSVCKNLTEEEFEALISDYDELEKLVRKFADLPEIKE